MGYREKIKELSLKYESLLKKIQGSTVFKYRQSYNQLYSQLEILITSLKQNDLKLLKEGILKVQRDFNRTLRDITYTSLYHAERVAFEKFSTQLKVMLDIGLSEKEYKKAIDIYTAKVPIKIDKRFISTRIWNINKPYFDAIKAKLEKGIYQGLGAKKLSKELKKFVKSPTPIGKGIYRDARKNAERLVRTEIKRAYQIREYNQMQKLPFIKGVQVNLAAEHFALMPNGDICDELAGIYPPDYKFASWHPNCLCYTTIIRASNDDTKKILRGEQKVKETTIPVKYNKWLEKNKDRYKKKPPLFLKENPKYSL